MSMANTAEGLYDRMADNSLTREHNNAAVTVVMNNNEPAAVMYAVRDIAAGEEIMWDYNVHENDSVLSTPTPTAGSAPYGQHTIQRLSAVISALERSASRIAGTR